MAIDRELVDQLLAGRDPKDLFLKDGPLDDLKKALSGRILDAELDEHLEQDARDGGGNRRNGTSKKTVLTGTSRLTISVPRDRAGSFDPVLIAKCQRRLPDFDEKIISMYARGLSVREIRAHPEEIYGINVSPDLISAVTDAVLEEVAEWQDRPLDAVYPLVFFDAIRVKIRDEGFVRNKKDRKPAGAALRAIYRARDADAGLKALEDFDAGPWGQRYRAIARSWRRNWSQIVPFLAFPESVRGIIYTTNAIEALNAKVRRRQNQGAFSNR